VPAGCANAITVGAVDSTLTKAAFSNYGTKTDVAAPGVSIYSSLPGNTYGTWAGTSMATPYIAGLVSAIKTYKPALTVDDIKYILKTAALTEPVTSPVNIGRFPNMGKIFVSLGIKSDSELTNPPSPTTGSGTTGTGTTTPPIGTGSNAPNPIIDTTPPKTTIFPYVSLTNATGTTLTVAISENGSGYYVVLPSSASAPSNTSIVNMNNIIALRINTPSLVKI
jgi:subtilisin family serine protease